MECRECKNEFTPNPYYHRKWGICSGCRIINTRRIKAKYKKTEKGRQSYLRWCQNPIKKVIDKKSRQTPRAKKLAVIRTRKFLRRHPEYQEKRKIYQKHWIDRIGYENYRKINNKATNKYQKTEAGKRVHRQYKYLSRNNKAGKIDWIEWENKIMKLGNKCQNCGTIKNITIDHIIPLSKGGGNNIENLQPLCRSCNCRKNKNLWKQFVSVVTK